MKTVTLFYPLFFLLAFSFAVPETANAQRGIIKRKIKQDMEEKYADPQRQKGKEELKKITYEHDKRFSDSLNRIQATIAFESMEIDKKGKTKNEMTQKIVFGKRGECIVMNEGEKNETWIIYNYADKANYMVNVKEKSAVKMPLISMRKMIEAGARYEAEKNATSSSNSWKNTGERQNVNGYPCVKYIYTFSNDRNYSSMDVWLSAEVRLNLGDNYMFGARLSAYNFPPNPAYKEMANGFIVRSVIYNKKGNPVSQRDLKEFKKSANESYFDMSKFKVTDVMGLL